MTIKSHISILRRPNLVFTVFMTISGIISLTVIKS